MPVRIPILFLLRESFLRAGVPALTAPFRPILHQKVAYAEIRNNQDLFLTVQLTATIYSNFPEEIEMIYRQKYNFSESPCYPQPDRPLSLIHISEPTRLGMISYAV